MQSHFLLSCKWAAWGIGEASYFCISHAVIIEVVWLGDWGRITGLVMTLLSVFMRDVSEDVFEKDEDNLSPYVC